MDSISSNKPSTRRRDRRLAGAALTVLSVAGLGYFFQQLPGHGVVADTAAKAPMTGIQTLVGGIAERRDMEVPVPVEEQIAPETPNANRVRRLLKEASDLIRARQYDEAIRSMNDVRDQLKEVPQTYLVLGRALEGMGEYAAARDFYNAAIKREPFMSDAYWGFATTSESLGDLPSALGAMRSYLHTEPDADPYRRRIARARSAIWEWETALGRGPWGPTKGIPPGYSAAEMKRDGRGAGMKMPLPNTENAAGVSKSETKFADKIPVYQR